MASLLCFLFGSLYAKHKPLPSTMGLFIKSNKTCQVFFLIAATPSVIGRLLLLTNFRHGIDNFKSPMCSSPASALVVHHLIHLRTASSFGCRTCLPLPVAEVQLNQHSKIANKRGSRETLTLIPRTFPKYRNVRLLYASLAFCPYSYSNHA